MGIFKDFANQIEKDFKKKKKQVLFNSDTVREVVSSGSLIIDKVFEGGLFYRGAMGEISSFESGAKTTTALSTCAEALEKYPDEGIMYFDFEKSLDPAYAKTLGVDLDDERVMVFVPDCIEDMMNILIAGFSKKKGGKLIGKISTIVIDSVASARPMSSIELGEGSAQKSQHASAWAEITPKLMTIASNYNVAIVLINQFRSKPMMDRNSQFSLANTGIGQGYSNMETSLTTCVTYDTKIKVRIDGVEKEVIMAELEKLLPQDQIVDWSNQ